MKPAFQLIAGHPALDLVNTLDYRFRKSGAEDLLESYDDLLRFCEQSNILTPKQTRQLRRSASASAAAEALKNCAELREAVAEVLYKWLDRRSPSAEPLRILEGFFKAARLVQRLSWSGSRPEWEWAGQESHAGLPLWALTMSAFELMMSEGLGRVRACDSPECRWLFLDTSKNHTRRWCDMRLCGNRMKARRFKAQRQA